jgi:hypothetical protein
MDFLRGEYTVLLPVVSAFICNWALKSLCNVHKMARNDIWEYCFVSIFMITNLLPLSFLMVISLHVPLICEMRASLG